MPENLFNTVAVPSGMNNTDDPVNMAPDDAQLIVNMETDRMGRLQGKTAVLNILAGTATTSVPADGIGYIYANSGTIPLLSVPFNLNSVLVWASNGFLFTSQYTPAINSSYPPVITGLNLMSAPIVYTPPFAGGKRVRFVTYGLEAYVTQEGGTPGFRIYAGGLYKMSLLTGTVPTVTTPAATGLRTGVVQYMYTYIDEQLRESSPSPAASVTLSTANDASVQVPAPSSFNTSALSCNIYCTLTNANTFYRVSSQHAISSPFVHNDTDANISAGILAPAIGENDPPHNFSIMAMHKNYLVTNDTTVLNGVQLSNLAAPTQFAAFQVNATDGAKILVPTKQGDYINGICSMGDTLLILGRRQGFILWGDTLADFTVRPVYEHGCVSPDSVVNCDGVAMWLSADGVYQTSGAAAVRVSHKIEDQLLGTSMALLETSVAWYFNLTYYLAVGTVIYCYSFLSNGWYELSLS